MAYRSYVHAKVCGPNWLMVGESASLPDPATANGVTAALRHALSAATYILQAKTGQLSSRQRRVYDTNVRRMGHVFNHSIETAVYGGTIRRGFGGFVAQRVYTAFSYVVNALYSRMRPESSARMAAFGLLVKFVWVWMVLWSLAGRSATFARRLPLHPVQWRTDKSMRVYQTGTGPPVLFLHGLPTSGRLWDYVVPQLAPFFTCVVVDLPGSGTSAPLADKSLDPERYVDEIRGSLPPTRPAAALHRRARRGRGVRCALQRALPRRGRPARALLATRISRASRSLVLPPGPRPCTWRCARAGTCHLALAPRVSSFHTTPRSVSRRPHRRVPAAVPRLSGLALVHAHAPLG